MDPKKEKKAEPAPAAPPINAADDWSSPESHPRISPMWPLVWFALALCGIVLWGFLSG
jgi:hypothetical protein